MPVEVFTADQRITGYMAARELRLLDILNNAGQSFLLLHEVSMISLRGPLSQVTQVSMLRVNKNGVLFVLPHDEVGTAPRKRLYSYVAKKQLCLYVAMQGFELRGNAHFNTVGVHTRDMLIDLPGSHFMPLTDTQIAFFANPAISFQAGVVGVNKALIETVGIDDRLAAHFFQ